MNQPRGRCITGRLLTEPRNFSFPDLNANDSVSSSDGDDNDNWQDIDDSWQDIDTGLDFPLNGLYFWLKFDFPGNNIDRRST